MLARPPRLSRGSNDAPPAVGFMVQLDGIVTQGSREKKGGSRQHLILTWSHLNSLPCAARPLQRLVGQPVGQPARASRQR